MSIVSTVQDFWPILCALHFTPAELRYASPAPPFAPHRNKHNRSNSQSSSGSVSLHTTSEGTLQCQLPHKEGSIFSMSTKEGHNPLRSRKR